MGGEGWMVGRMGGEGWMVGRMGVKGGWWVGWV